MKTSRALALGAVCFALGAGAMWAQQQVASGRVPQFENDQLRVWKTTLAPHAPLTLHRHDHGRALVALTDGQLRVKDKNGKILNEYNLKRGTAIWLGVDPPGQMHTDANDGDKPIEVIVVQLQQDTVGRRP
jgi:quercetin dioxygenase-like cupin family protein